jgi:hypothetical protein
MLSIAAAGKKLALWSFTMISLIQVSSIGGAAAKWAHYWGANSSKIITLTTINTTMTFGTEFVSRSILSRSLTKDKSYRFIVGEGRWYNNINRQSLINIWMTFFASLLGAPVYFFRRRHARFAFFVGFGVFNSALSQGLLGVLREGVILISAKRLLFDFFYNGSLKFFMFEFYRKPIKAKTKFFSLYWVRGKQDLLTGVFKNLILNLLRFKG